MNILTDDAMLVLNKYFVFDEIFNLLDYDQNMGSLHAKLSNYKKDVYDQNYRFIFLHYDTEYYVNSELPGLTLLNLQRILSDLDIPNYFCLILTQQDLTWQLEYLKNSESTDSVPISHMKIMLHNPLYQDDSVEIDVSAEIIERKFITLNRVKRFHRRLLIAGLRDKNLLDDGFVSYNSKD